MRESLRVVQENDAFYTKGGAFLSVKYTQNDGILLKIEDFVLKT